MRRHDLDLTSLVAGLVLVAISVAYLVGSYTNVRIGSGWVLPFALIGLGGAGLAGSLRTGLRRGDQSGGSNSTDATDETHSTESPDEQPL